MQDVAYKFGIVPPNLGRLTPMHSCNPTDVTMSLEIKKWVKTTFPVLFLSLFFHLIIIIMCLILLLRTNRLC